MPQLSLQGLARPLLLLSTMALSSPLKADNTSLDDLLNLITPASSQTAVWIEDLQSGEQLLSHNSETLMIPASTQKLLTAVTATELLGEEFRYHTSILSTGSPKSGVLKGDLYLLFSGDPTLTRRDLTELFKRVTEAGISQVQGNLILIGETHEQLRAPGWVWDDLGICYAAPVSSYVINQNCVHGKLEPTLASDKAKISAPVYLPVKLTTNAIFDKGHKQDFANCNSTDYPATTFISVVVSRLPGIAVGAGGQRPRPICHRQRRRHYQGQTQHQRQDADLQSATGQLKGGGQSCLGCPARAFGNHAAGI